MISCDRVHESTNRQLKEVGLDSSLHVSQILHQMSRLDFESGGRRHNAERHARGFTSWGGLWPCCFVGWVMHSVGDLPRLGGHGGRLRHWGLSEVPRRSTLAYANEHRPWQVRDGVHRLLDKCRTLAACRTEKKSKFRFKNKLISLDATCS